jgi:hypothetical protein
MTDIYQHLSYIQKHLNAPKNRRNSFGNYNYRNCEDIVEAVKKILPEGCSIVLRDQIVVIGDRFYVRAEAVLLCKEGSIESSALARESLDKKGMDSAQITGAASSYARKYALNGLFAIDDNDDIDSKDNTQEPKKAQQATAKPVEQAKPPIVAGVESVFLSKDQVFKLSKMIFDAKIDAKLIYEKYKVTSYEQLTNTQAKEIASECSARYATV